ncbi:MAG: hypothetical protein KF757_04190 [Phycisphaeraceae bacterium]|nr:hypothetical protein [Phycisphaeraceae bacterium]MCW5763202.1 hypothetical protein [Phycisphaeraceae bacterium]
MLCEHAMLMQAVAPHVEREGPSRVRIRSWPDATLGCMMPVSISQTWGLSVRVADLRAARVAIDQTDVADLARFEAADGRWVTLMPSTMRDVVFDHVDPLARPDAHARGVGVQARFETGPGGGQLMLEGTGSVSFEPRWLDARGAQAFVYTMQARSADAALAWLVETRDGGRFAWGDAEIIAGLDALTAQRAEPVARDARIAVPLWDLTWAEGATPGGPLPTRAIARISLVSRGRCAIAEAAFIRPSPAQPDAPRRGTVILGSVPTGARDWSVVCSDPDGRGQRSSTPDKRGWFAFDGINRPVMLLRARDAAGQWFAPIGGALVETRYNQTSVRFAPVDEAAALLLSAHAATPAPEPRRDAWDC